MTVSWRDAVLGFGAGADAAGRLLAASPAFVWSADGARILWANPAGGRLLGASSFQALAGRSWPEAHPLRRALASLARSATERETLARLRLGDDLHALPTAWRCRSVRSGAGRALLVAGLEPTGAAPSLDDLAAFFSGGRIDAVVVDHEGAVVTGAPRDGGLSPSAPHIEFSHGGRALRLHLVERPVAEATEPALPTGPPRLLNDAGLTMRPAGRGPQPPEVFSPERQAERPAAPPPIEPPLAEPAPPPAARERPEVFIRPDELEKPPARSVMAGRVQRELSRKPVRFLWQTDSADRFLFASPGLAQVVGRNADVIGERWGDLSVRLRLDPAGRIVRALRQRDTWSGLTAWWPIEGSAVRVPTELTALPIFGPDQSFQGYRGFGILRPAEALMPAAFEARFGPEQAPLPDPQPPYEESVGLSANVVPIRSDIDRVPEHALTQQERNAFEEIAAALRDRIVGELPVSNAAVEDPHEGEFDEPPAEARAEPVVPLFPDREAQQEHREVEHDLPSEPKLAEPARKPDLRSPSNSPVSEAPARTPFSQPYAGARAASSSTGSELAEVRQRLAELSAILDTATDGVLILDSKGTIESANASAEALFGLDANEIEGRGLGELLTRASRQPALDYLSGLKDSGVASILNEGREIEAAAGGGTIPLFMTMGRISSDEGGRFCAVLRDITHWKRIEADLTQAKLAAEEASQQKSDFLARVSHEVRTPLNAIIGFAEVMIEERFGAIANQRYREYLRDIRTSGEHVVSLVNDLLDISKIEAGKLDLRFAAVSLNGVVGESIALMQPQANRSRVVLRSSLSRDVPDIVADERTLRQIVLNLLSNAVKFTEPGGQVIASTTLAETGEALLRVRDTGPGMTDEELARALEPFRQLATAAMSDRSGTGLGLPLTKALVEANRAALSIRSTPGEGTVVTVTIPPTRVLSE